MTDRLVLVLLVVAAFTAGFCHGERQERGRWFYWSGEHVAWEAKGNRLK